MFNKQRLQSLRSNIELGKNIVEIVAILLAGIWAYSKYNEAEKPLLLVRNESSSVLDWYATPWPDKCLARFGMTVRNIGTMRFEVSRVKLRTWALELNSPIKDISLVDKSVFKWTKLEDRVYESDKTNSLIGFYNSGEENHMSYNFVVKNKSPEQRMLAFELKAIGPSVNMTQHRWSFICDVQKPDKE